MSVMGAVADAASRGCAQRRTVRGDAVSRGGAVLRDGAAVWGDVGLRDGAMLQDGAVGDGVAVRAR
ncbi:hypothetical protein ACGFIJ_31215 [Microbispora bryophytorum]|uniref:hypothetical protein n=1 Tax=Microbispora bryophytorum TaxID=1460882 RepID=UPI003712B07E